MFIKVFSFLKYIPQLIKIAPILIEVFKSIKSLFGGKKDKSKDEPKKKEKEAPKNDKNKGGLKVQYSKKCLDFVKKWEGFHQKAYYCQADVPTIGWGTTRYCEGTVISRNGREIPISPGEKVQMGDKITEVMAELNLKHGLNDCAWRIKGLLKVKPTQYQFDAMVSLTYNIGIGGFSESTCLRKFNEGDIEEAADAILLWNKTTIDGKKVVSQGLVNRRREEREMFLSGNTDELPTYPTIKYGDTGEAVRVLQKALIDLRYFPANEVVDGIFGNNTKSKVKNFQRDQNIYVDGIVGPQTWKELYRALNAGGGKPSNDNWEGLQGNYIVVKKTSMKKPNGLVVLDVRFYENGKFYKSIYATAGQAYAQNFRKGNESYSGSMEPPSETKKGYRVHDIRWASGKDNYNAAISAGLGPFFVWIEPHDKGDTRRREIGFHIDWNKSTAPGSAGCIVVDDVSDGKKLIELLRHGDPRQLYVDWGLGYAGKH